MSKPAALGVVIAGAGVGFLVGFIWGAGTREALPGATSTSYSGGVFTLQVNAGQALREGLRAFLG